MQIINIIAATPQNVLHLNTCANQSEKNTPIAINAMSINMLKALYLNNSPKNTDNGKTSNPTDKPTKVALILNIPNSSVLVEV